MAEVAKEGNGGDTHDLHSLLSSPARDFLVRNDGEQVKIESLKGKKIGLYFSAARYIPCQQFTPKLVEVYNELSPTVSFEIVFVSLDEDEESFKDYFTKMPWLAVPFTNSETRVHLGEVFKVSGSPTLIIVDDHGEVVNEDTVSFIGKYGADAYPFTPERMKEIKEEEDRARIEQTLKSVFVTPSRDFVISPEGDKVPVSKLEGKTIGLLLSVPNDRRCREFTPKLSEFYKKLKENGEDFEIVQACPEESFKQELETKLWLSLPLDNKSVVKLCQHFKLLRLPTLVILGPDGKTRHSNVAEAIDEYGVLAYPFTPEKFEELMVIEKAKAEAQSLESLLVSADLNYVLGKDGDKVLVSDLVGKDILLYFSAQWSFHCRYYTQRLAEVYRYIKKDVAFELIFISSDRDQEAFEEYYSQMPWLALPFGDPRIPSLSKIFKASGIPCLVPFPRTRKIVTKEALHLLLRFSPHTLTVEGMNEIQEGMNEIQVEYDEMAKGWPKKLQHPLHEEHELELAPAIIYWCDKCDEVGDICSYSCRDCDFDLHAKCALKEDTKETGDEAAKGGGDGWFWPLFLY